MPKPRKEPDFEIADDSRRPEVASTPETVDGDRDLIRWALSLSREERLAALQDFVDSFWTPQHG